MSIRTILTVPTPCHENWATMTSAAQGRHCAACNKVVVDFTQKTDAEILALLGKASSACGRFREDQLQRPLLPPPMPTPRWQTWLAATAAVLGLREVSAEKSVAQHTLYHVTDTITPVEPLAPQLMPAGTKLRGWIRLPNGMALPGATVSVERGTIQTVTAADGSFSLLLPVSAINDDDKSIALHVQAQGYTQQKVVILLGADSTEPVSIYLQPLTLKAPVSIIMGGISATPVPVRNR